MVSSTVLELLMWWLRDWKDGRVICRRLELQVVSTMQEVGQVLWPLCGGSAVKDPEHLVLGDKLIMNGGRLFVLWCSIADICWYTAIVKVPWLCTDAIHDCGLLSIRPVNRRTAAHVLRVRFTNDPSGTVVTCCDELIRWVWDWHSWLTGDSLVRQSRQNGISFEFSKVKTLNTRAKPSTNLL